MWDTAKYFQALYTHYHKFSRITFDAIPQAEWWQFYRDLLPMKDAFTYGETIGHVDFPCALEVEDECPINQWALQYKPSKCVWLQ